MIRNNKKVKSDYDLIDTFSSMESNYGNMKKKRLDLGDMQAVSSLKYPQAISICPIYFPYLHSLSCYETFISNQSAQGRKLSVNAIPTYSVHKTYL